MAKGNLFLGTARGSVGDVTMYQNRGQQAARVRKRVIANPESDRQIVTRAILSTVAKAYSAGRAIFDHAFEGYKKGQANQDRFSKLNISALRAAYNEDISTEGRTAFQCKGRFVQKNAQGPVAFSFIVSEGSLSQNLFSLGVVGSSDKSLALNISPTADASGGVSQTVGEYMAANGINVGDIFTLVGFGYNDYNIYSDYDSYYAGFQFIRFKCDPSSAVMGGSVDNTTWSELFDIDFSVPMPIDLGGSIYGAMSDSNIFAFEELGLDTHGAFGIIRSRDDRDLRSNCVLQCSFDVDQAMAAEQYQWGLTSLTVTNGWRSQSPEALDSPLILEGGNVAAALDEIGKE